MTDCDVAVVGRGPTGSAAARHLTRMGAKVLLVGPGEPTDRASHRGVFASHYDSGRICRITDKDPYYSQIAAASIARFNELQESTGVQFWFPVGHLTVGSMPEHMEALGRQAKHHKLDHSELHDAELKAQFPQLRFGAGMTAIHERATGGFMDPRRFIVAQQSATKMAGGEVLDCVVTGLASLPGGVRLSTSQGTFDCGKVLLATGAFANHLGIIPAKVEMEIHKHTVVFGEVTSDIASDLAAMPTVIYKRGDGARESVYLTPPVRYPNGGTYIKIGHSAGPVMPDPASNLVPWFQGSGDQAIASWLLAELAELLPGVSFASTHSDSCVVVKAPNSRQFIDRFPKSSVFALLGDNGQVAKSADELGRIAANRVLTGEVPGGYDPDMFRIKFE